jgi:hypothetical protein
MFARLEGYVNNIASDWKNTNTIITSPPLLTANQPPPDNLNLIGTGVTPDSSIDILTRTSAYQKKMSDLDTLNASCIKVKQPQDILDMNIQGIYQCGWYYNTTKKTGQGYLSDKNGPLPNLTSGGPPNSPYTFYFGSDGTPTSLQAAQERYDMDRCSPLKTCSQVGNYPGCGYCTSSLKGIPINPDNSPKYPSNVMATCYQPNIVTNTTKCPVPPPVPVLKPTSSSGITYPKLAGNCRPEANGRLSGVCLQTALKNANCQPQGALFTALNGFSSTTDLGSLQKNNANIGTYADLKPNFNLNKFVMAPTIEDAQTQAIALSTASASAATAAKVNREGQTKANTLAIDLCSKSGYFLDQYDFCTELQPNTPIPTVGWDLGCLQAAFMKTFQIKTPPAGNMYPKTKGDCAHRHYNTMGTWGDVTKFMDSIYNNMYNGGPMYTNPCGPNPGPLAGGGAFQSKPFKLQSLNFPDRFLRWTSNEFGGPPMIVPYYDSGCNFIWKTSPLDPKAIQLVPVNSPTSLMRHAGFELRVAKQNLNDQLLQKDSSFFVRNGNAGSGTISFESLNYPGYFLRHAGFRMWLHQKVGNDDLYNKDSSFFPFTVTDNKSQNMKFFTAQKNVQIPNYPGQQAAVNTSIGAVLDPAQTVYTEGFQSTPNQGLELLALEPIHGIHTITSHATVPSLKHVNVGGLSLVYTLAHYASPTNQTVVASHSVNPGNTLDAMINGYLKDKPNALDRFPVSARQTNLVKTLWKSNGRPGSEYSYTIKPDLVPYIPLRPQEPFLRFEPFSDPVYTGNKYVFTEVRAPEIANVQLGGALPEFHATGISVLKCPGTHGFVHLSSSQFNIPYVDLTLCQQATFCFSVAQIPSCTARNPSTVLRLCNRTQDAMVNGYNCAVYGSTNGNISFVIQTPGKSTSPVSLTVDKWYTLTLNKETVRLHSIDTQTNTSSLVSTIPLAGTHPIQKSTNRIGPLIQIGDASTSLRLNVAWLHLY